MQLLESVTAALRQQGALSSSDDDAPSSVFSISDAEAQAGDSQYFVQFSSDAGDDTLKAFAAFTGRPVLQYIADRAFLALGDATWANKSRTYPGVIFVQQRTPPLRDALSLPRSSLPALSPGPSSHNASLQTHAPELPPLLTPIRARSPFTMALSKRLASRQRSPA